MTKLRNPLLSLKASGTIARVLTFVRRRGVNLVEKKPVPEDPRSLAQLSWRHMYQKAVALWHALSAAEQLIWETQARSRHMSGFAWFMSQALRPNPGLYLPLQGGTMAGDIAMATNKITGLPLPTGSGHAARKSYVDALSEREGHITVIPCNYSAIGQGTWALGAASGYYLDYIQNTTHDDGDNISYAVILAKGTYSLRVIYHKSSAAAIVDVYLDAAEIGSFDGYAVAAQFNNTYTITGVVVAAPGFKTVKFLIDGKHASSSDHYLTLQVIGLWRTA